ncbi:hypothetical protein ACJ41O_010774 [Fusarium nematophilum]
MQLAKFSILAAMIIGNVMGDLHYTAVCRGEKEYPRAPYVINKAATECACNRYKNRNTGSKHWDQCPDCQFDGTYCRSRDAHIGGDEASVPFLFQKIQAN